MVLVYGKNQIYDKLYLAAKPLNRIKMV